MVLPLGLRVEVEIDDKSGRIGGWEVEGTKELWTRMVVGKSQMKIQRPRFVSVFIIDLPLQNQARCHCLSVLRSCFVQSILSSEQD